MSTVSDVATESSLAPSAGQTWRVLRAPLGVLTAVLVTGLVVGWLGSRNAQGDLDPAAATPAGSRAVAQLLAAKGVTVERVRTTEEATARIQKDWKSDTAAYDKVREEILQMSDMLATGIVEQFPDKFGGRRSASTK